MDWNKLMKEARRQGWQVVKSASRSHYKWLSPDGKTVVVSSSSPSDHRAIRNHLSLLRRGGFTK